MIAPISDFSRQSGTIPCPSMPLKSSKPIKPASPAMAAAVLWAIPKSIWKWGMRISWSAPIATGALCSKRAPLHMGLVIIERPEKGGPSLPGRRLGLSVPRLSRPAAVDAQIRRAAGRGRVRLLQHVVEAVGGYEGAGAAHPPGGDL